MALSAWAEEPADDNDVVEEPQAEEPRVEEAQVDKTSVDKTQGDGIKSPKTLSGMSILGNEEAPKSLVIVPWKSSQMGDEINLSDTLDDRARPVDKEVFERELRFYQIRSGEQT
jgi:hypothetical protein